MHKCLSIELHIGDKTCNFVACYRSPKSKNDFESFADNFEMTLEILVQKDHFLIGATSDFTGKSQNWYNKDKTSLEGDAIENITSELGVHHLINEPKHILQNSTTCTDLIFASHSNLVIESGVRSSLH